jgi:methionyl aminopeptidase
MNTKKLELMAIGGQHLGQIKKELAKAIAAGVTPLEIDALADRLIAKAGDTPSFKTVKNYHHATCINVNAAVVHGIPNDRPFKPGDLVTIDVGLVHQGWHLDTSLTVQVPPLDPKVTRFLEAGQEAVSEALKQALPGKTIYDVSKAMQTVIEAAGYSVIRDLTGHGIGRALHEDPYVPCYADPAYRDWVIKPGQALAVEIMYAMGGHKLKLESDGWTLSTADGSLSAMFEETVFITPSGQSILTL